MKDKPIISNQHGALVMAFVPFCYAITETGFIFNHFWLGLSWLFLYLFSYPFFQIFSKKNNEKAKKWAKIYFALSLLFAFPLLLSRFDILQFLLPLLPLALVQIHYTKQKDERNLLNDIAGILTFGIIGMATAYLTDSGYHWPILLHPTLFFIATTFYVKSVARERKNPRYRQLSYGSHSLLGLGYLAAGMYGVAFAYLCGLIRAVVVPKKNLNIKQVGMLEFVIILIFFVALVS